MIIYDYCIECGKEIPVSSKWKRTIYGDTICERCVCKGNYVECEDSKGYVLRKDTYQDELDNHYLLMESIIIRKLLKYFPKRFSEIITNELIQYIDQAIEEEPLICTKFLKHFIVYIKKSNKKVEINLHPYGEEKGLWVNIIIYLP